MGLLGRGSSHIRTVPNLAVVAKAMLGLLKGDGVRETRSVGEISEVRILTAKGYSESDLWR